MTQPTYIICGLGAAGCSLLYRMMHEPFFADKQILVIDKAPKTGNDRTWCFWEKGNGVFEKIVHHRWPQAYFHSTGFSKLMDLHPYQYKMIRSAALYDLVMSEVAQRSNISFVYEAVTGMGNNAAGAYVQTTQQRYFGKWVFNSILFAQPKLKPGEHHLLQHFKGWFIKTASPAFQPQTATLMDFRVSQQHGTTFVYVLPFSENEALVEYTLFTPTLLQQQEYDAALKQYIEQTLLQSDYRISETEFGIIPMTNARFNQQDGNIIYMGTAGGQTKPSSGYTFRFIQKHCDGIIDMLVNNKSSVEVNHFAQRKFFWYDSVLLNVLARERMPGDKVFATLFKQNQPQEVFRFLDNETSLTEDLRIIASLPWWPFIKAGIDEVL